MNQSNTTSEPNRELAPQYDPQAVEQDIFAQWMKATNGFHAAANDPAHDYFSVVIPPPNVTGALHLGHAINGTIQDILVRYHRMRGDATLWMPGIDHAGIATQAVVERTIFETEKRNRHDLGRDELVKRIWEWKEKFGDRILEQLKRMGSSCDWPRTRFTLDDLCARAVREAFFKLFKDGLIFRGLRLVNWDTHLQTAVADDEIYYETVKGQMTSIRYPIADRRDGDPEFLVVATTRPETMLGDTAVAIHPDDPRYKHLIGRQVIVPLVGRSIPIIGDGLLVDPKFGTGVVKVTPAHDPNDYATGQRHNLQQINLLTPDGKVNGNGDGTFNGEPYKYIGLKFATEARRAVLEDLETLGLIAEVKLHEHEVGHSDRSKTPIEPFLSEQWFVKMGDVDGGITLANGRKVSGLAQAAMDAVEDGGVKITPDRYSRGYVDWLSKKRDWCISRQLWWGHRIPVWTVNLDHSDRTEKSLTKESSDLAVSNCKRVLTKILADAGVRESDYLIRKQSPYQSPNIVARTTEAADAIESIIGYRECTKGFIVGSKPVPDKPDWRNTAVCNKIMATKVGQACMKHGNELADFIMGPIIQDPDVLDTWFSSALWPLSTMGWPAAGTSDAPEDQLLNRFYPTSVLSTAREILTLWVARMVMFGLYCHGEVPFKQVYIHAVIQDGQGRPMKKSLGNGVDPVDIIASHGADALRYTLASMATETQDIRLPVVKDKAIGKNTSPRFDVGRNFANKLWNASRFILSHLDIPTPPSDSDIQALAANPASDLADRWILSRLNSTVAKATECMEDFRFAELAAAFYQFIWNDLCDWYLEIAKPRINRKDASVQQVLMYVLRRALALLHPVMPYVTEAIWSKLPHSPGSAAMLVVSPFPKAHSALDNPTAEKDIDLAQQVTRAIRDLRNSYNVDLKKKLEVVIQPESANTGAHILACRGIIEPLANAAILACDPKAQPPADSATALVPGAQIFVAGIVDKQAEAKKLSARRKELTGFIASGKTKLANENFVAKAPPAVVDGLRLQLDRQETELAAIEASLRQYAAAT